MGKKKAAVNKSQSIRDYLAKHPDSQNKDVAGALEKYGVNSQDVANLKARLKASAGTRSKKKAVKRGMPSKNCPKCNKTMHVAKVACECGYKFPVKKKKKPVKITVTSSGEGTLSRKLEESIRIVEKAGGIDQAKQVLAAVKDLENLN
jgi:hypothetical protein